MTPTLYWIDGPWAGRLAISARPRGGDRLEDEVKSWKSAGINVVASLLEPEEVEALNLNEEANLSRDNGISFEWFPIPDRKIPESYMDALHFIRGLEIELIKGKKVVVHCQQGLGRSAIIAASLLELAGLPAEAAIDCVRAARGCSVPETVEQVGWVARFAQDRVRVRLQEERFRKSTGFLSLWLTTLREKMRENLR